MKRKSAFTLIELLVVIAIIAILAAILFPVFAAAREKARQTTCLSNLKQLGLAFTQYEQDYDEMLPSGRLGDVAAGCSTGQLACFTNWTFDIYPYVKSRNVFTCPDDPTTASTALGAGTGTPVPISYMANGNALVDHTTSNGGYTVASLAKFNSPAVTVLLLESQKNYNDPSLYVNAGSNEPGDVFIPTTNNTSQEGVSASQLATGPLGGETFNDVTMYATGRHSNTGSCFLMADGHVKFLPGSLVSPGYEPQQNSENSGCYQNQYAPLNCAWGGASYINAAGTGNMTDNNGHTFAVTFSKV